jgi:hypothetical protein
MLTKHEEKEDNIFSFYFYSKLLVEDQERQVTINLKELDIHQHDLAELDVPFSEEQVWRIVPCPPTRPVTGWFHRKFL